MGTFSVWHWLIVLAVILLLFGAKKIPELAKGLGSGIKNFKKAIKEDEEEEEGKKPESVTMQSPQQSTQPTHTTPQKEQQS